MKPNPASEQPAKYSAKPWVKARQRNAAAITALPATRVNRTPTWRINHAGTVLVRPQNTPNKEKPVPASAKVQCSSLTIAGSTTPREVKVAAVIRKNSRLTQPRLTQALLIRQRRR